MLAEGAAAPGEPAFGPGHLQSPSEESQAGRSQGSGETRTEPPYRARTSNKEIIETSVTLLPHMVALCCCCCWSSRFDQNLVATKQQNTVKNQLYGLDLASFLAFLFYSVHLYSFI